MKKVCHLIRDWENIKITLYYKNIKYIYYGFQYGEERPFYGNYSDKLATEKLTPAQDIWKLSMKNMQKI